MMGAIKAGMKKVKVVSFVVMPKMSLCYCIKSGPKIRGIPLKRRGYYHTCSIALPNPSRPLKTL